MFPYHPDYGLPNTLRMSILKAAEICGVRHAAELHNVAPQTIYKWRRDLHATNR